MDGAEVQALGDNIVYRASSLGACTKRLVAIRLGYEPLPVPEIMRTRFQEGHLHEGAVLDLMRTEGWRLFDEQAEVKLKVSERISVVGHLDAKGYYLERGHIVEVKSQSEEEFRRFGDHGWEGGLFPKYKWQVSVYMLATGFGLCLVRKNRNSGAIETSYWDEPFYSLSEIRARVLEIEAWAIKGELPECKGTDFPCPVAYLHEQKDPTPLDDPGVEALARQYLDAQRDERVAKERKTATKKTLEEAVAGEDRIETKTGVKVTFYFAKNPPQFSEKKMRDDGIDPAKYKVQTESKRIKVTLPKDKDDTGRNEDVGGGRDREATKNA